ncbi:unnamed protein product [Pleuronectes platessa]|uniref:Ig-like domain-containing protein n=1 Tax=Pleuronectes platessa TaxID=8262 RepID=A0A9N7YVW0_PLEPL|nr:unnamed protein product [Pleuronectes platessa]
MFPLRHAGVWPLFLFILKGVSCDELTPDQTAEFSVEGSSVTLSYKFSRTITGQILAAPTSGLKIQVEQNQIHMIISSAAVTDSAVYYCAVSPQ